MLRDGLLRDYEAGRHGRNRLLESDPPGRCPLRDHIAANVQLRHDSPLGQRHGPIAELSDADLAAYCDEHLNDDALAAAMAPINEWTDNQTAPAWDRIADRLNSYLGPAWPGPPWDGDQSATVAMALALAQEAAAQISA